MIKTLIIEDEAVAARSLKRMLGLLPSQFEVVAILDTVASVISTLPSLDVDLVFMDIRLSDGNAFQIFEQLKISTPIVFTTAFDEYTLKAFKQNSVDYLLKPIDKTELGQAVQKFEDVFLSSNTQPENNYQSLVKLLMNDKNYKKKFLVQVGKKMKSLETKEVAFFFVEEKTTYLQTFGEKKYIIDYSLSQLEAELDPDVFYRVNRQFLLASAAIVDVYYLSTTRLKVNLDPSPKIDVLLTVDKIGKFKRWLGR